MGTPSPTATTEVEVKLDLSAEAHVPAIEGFSVVSDDEVTLTATYWDTSDLRLLAWGHTLRRRDASDGSEAGWTLKLDERSGGTAARRREISLPGDSTWPPSALVTLVRAFIRREQLVPIATITTVRGRRRLHSNGGSPGMVEVDDDRVTSLVAQEPGPAFRQLEIELLDGDQELVDLVLAQVGPLAVGPPDATPKLVRVLGDRAPADQPLRQCRAGRRATIDDLVRAAIAQGIVRLATHDPGVRLGDDAEDVHQARVATRRLRSDLKTLEPLLEARKVEAVRQELRWFGELLGAVRDRDVLAARLVKEAEGLDADAREAVLALVERIRGERDERAIVLHDVMEGSRYINLVDDLVALAAHPPYAADVDPGRPARSAAARLAGTAWRRLSKSVGQLGGNPPLPALHEVRKRAKRARYAAELVSPVVGGSAGKLASRLADLQDELGELQDGVTAEMWFEGLSIDGLSPREAFATGTLRCLERQNIKSSGRQWRPLWRKADRSKLRRWMKT